MTRPQSRWPFNSGVVAFVLHLILGPAGVSAQTTPPRTYRSNAADEDWTFLKTAPKTDRWDPLKYITWGPDDWSLTLSGELRFRPEGFRIRETTTQPSTVDNYLLQRYLFGADARLGRRARIFGEVQSGIINGALRSPRPTDRNAIDLHQAFFQLDTALGGEKHFTVIAGRQEMEIGSSRLISASPGLNVKRSFDGVATGFRTKIWKVAGIAARLVALRSGAFDDPPDSEQLFWGGAVTRSGPALERSELGLYYLGADFSLSTYVQGKRPEVRHTFGVKWTGTGNYVDLNYDVVLQSGHFAGGRVRAWAFATDTGVRLKSRWRPRVSVRSDIASGDHDASEAALQSFNPLFPGNAYSGAVGLFGPTNLTDFTPGVTLVPRQGFTVGFEAPSYWRTSTGDGLYSTSLAVLFGPTAGTARYVGTNPGVLAIWRPTAHLELQGAITRFIAGAFLAETFVRAGFGFYSFTTRYRF